MHFQAAMVSMLIGRGWYLGLAYESVVPLHDGGFLEVGLGDLALEEVAEKLEVFQCLRDHLIVFFGGDDPEYQSRKLLLENGPELEGLYAENLHVVVQKLQQPRRYYHLVPREPSYIHLLFKRIEKLG